MDRDIKDEAIHPKFNKDNKSLSRFLGESSLFKRFFNATPQDSNQYLQERNNYGLLLDKRQFKNNAEMFERDLLDVNKAREEISDFRESGNKNFSSLNFLKNKYYRFFYELEIEAVKEGIETRTRHEQVFLDKLERFETVLDDVEQFAQDHKEVFWNKYDSITIPSSTESLADSETAGVETSDSSANKSKPSRSILDDLPVDFSPMDDE